VEVAPVVDMALVVAIVDTAVTGSLVALVVAVPEIETVEVVALVAMVAGSSYTPFHQKRLFFLHSMKRRRAI